MGSSSKNKLNVSSKNTLARLLLVIFIASTLIFSYGCTSLGGSSAGKTTDYHTGTKGIEINYAQGSPSNTIYDGIATQVSLEIWNKGAEAGSGTIFFDGYDPQIFPLTSRVSFPTIDGKEDAQNPQGGYYFLDIGKITPKLPEDTDYLPIPLRATVCYNYHTAASAKICIDTDPSKTGTKACTASNPSVGGGQGGPVSISAIQQDSSIGQTIFTITIKNVGGGRVISSSKTGACNELGYADYDEVSFSGSISQGQKLDCGKSNSIRLINSDATIVCKTATNPQQGAYVTTLKLDLNYGYMYSTTKNVEIRRI